MEKEIKDKILKEIGMLNPRLPLSIYSKLVDKIKTKWYKVYLEKQIIQP